MSDERLSATTQEALGRMAEAQHRINGALATGVPVWLLVAGQLSVPEAGTDLPQPGR